MTVCDAKIAHCKCGLEQGHDGPHDCGEVNANEPSIMCMGMWADSHPIRTILRYPTGAVGDAEALEDSMYVRLGAHEALREKMRQRAAACGKVIAP